MAAQQQGSDLQEAAARYGGGGAQIWRQRGVDRVTLRGDGQASVWRSGCDTEKQIENSPACADTEAVNRAGDKIKHETKSNVAEAECGTKLNGRSNRAGDQID
jgi:hypothetical protein